jgi:hypothetical protein
MVFFVFAFGILGFCGVFPFDCLDVFLVRVFRFVFVECSCFAEDRFVLYSTFVIILFITVDRVICRPFCSLCFTSVDGLELLAINFGGVRSFCV